MHEHDWTPNHYAKVRLARNLYAEQLISKDIGDELEELNRLRKDVAYGKPGGIVAGLAQKVANVVGPPD